MRKLIVPILAMTAIGFVATSATAVPTASTTQVLGKGSLVEARFFACAKGRHRGPLGYCRDNTARPLFIFRRPCALGRHRNFFGRCVNNR